MNGGGALNRAERARVRAPLVPCLEKARETPQFRVSRAFRIRDGTKQKALKQLEKAQKPHAI